MASVGEQRFQKVSVMPVFSKAELHEFIAKYRPSDRAGVDFDWNGRHGGEFRDGNHDFRKEVLDEVLSDLAHAPLELVRDLYLAETAFSAEAWCIDLRVGRLGEHLLRKGGDRFIEDYLEGKSRSFDASLAASAFQVDSSLAGHLLSVVRERLQNEEDNHRLALLKYGEETFGRWVRNLSGDTPR